MKHRSNGAFVVVASICAHEVKLLSGRLQVGADTPFELTDGRAFVVLD